MRKQWIAAGMAAALAGCGGGGGDSGGSGIGGAGPLALNGANYTVAAQESLAAGMFLSDTTGLVVAADVHTGSTRRWYERSLAELRRAPARLARLPQQVTGATQTFTEPCSGGGKMTVTGTDANGNNTVDAGDSLSIVAENCREEGELLNGGLSIVFGAVSGNLNGNVYSLSASLTMSGFSVSDSSGLYAGDGRFDMTITSSGVNSSVTNVSTAELTTMSTYGSVSSTQRLTGFSTREVVTPSGSGSLSTVTISGRLASSAFESKWVELSTTVPFVRSSTQSYPRSGQLAIIGASGSKARVTAVDASSVLVELDADGNGSYEASTTRLWRDLI